jgi:large subunit ribosomal protein LP0
MSKEKKTEYFAKTVELINTYSKLFVVSCDNVGSFQMQQIRLALRPMNTVVLMGKNTMMRKIVTDFLVENPGHPFGKLLPRIKGNIGFVFTDKPLTDVRDVLLANRVPAPAKVGGIAPIDVIVPAQVTDCDPGQTAFFQALQVATKINKGRIEITSDVDLLKAGDKVGPSEATLLTKLDIRPFTYGLVIVCIYDNGSIFDAKVLDITPEDLLQGFSAALGDVAALGSTAGCPNRASVPVSMVSAFKVLVSIAVECEEYSFKEADAYKAITDALKPKKAAAPAAEAAAEE